MPTQKECMSFGLLVWFFLNTHILDKKYKKYKGHRLFPGHICICNLKKNSNPNDIHKFLVGIFYPLKKTF